VLAGGVGAIAQRVLGQAAFTSIIVNGNADGSGRIAPSAPLIDAAGHLYVADAGSNPTVYAVGRSVSTGQGAWRRTRLVTLPMTK